MAELSCQGSPRPALSVAVEAFLTSDKVPVQRMTKAGLREFDARTAVIALDVANARLRMTLAHQTPLVRPDDVLTGLRVASPDFHATRPADSDETFQRPSLTSIRESSSSPVA